MFSSEVIRACEKLEVVYSPLRVEQASSLRSRIEASFAKPGLEPMWERLNEQKVSVHNPEARRTISEWTKADEVIIFFDLQEDPEMVLVADGAKLSEILGESFGFVFYLTDQNAEYLLTFNDHDMLIGLGKVRSWKKGFAA